jgi:hypothetical protein
MSARNVTKKLVGRGRAPSAFDLWRKQVDSVLWAAHTELTNDYGDRIGSMLAWWADGVSPTEAAERLHRGPSVKFGRRP